MDGRRRFYALVAITIFFGSLVSAWAQMRPGEQRWRALSPADRERFRSNAERWRQLPSNERSELRAREISRQEHLRAEAAAARRETGLQMEAERQAQFEARYLLERKRVEQELRREWEERRRREMAPVVERLKKEFAPPKASATSAPSAAPAASGSPQK